MFTTTLRPSILLYNGYRLMYPQKQSFIPFHEVITESTVHIIHTHTLCVCVCVCLTFNVSESLTTNGTIMSKREGNYFKKNYDLLQA